LLIKCLIHPIKQYKNFHHFLTSMDRWNRKKKFQRIKKINKNNKWWSFGIKKWISNISIFLKRIHNFPVLFDKISTQYNKIPHKSSISNISILKKKSKTFQNSFIKFLIHTIKHHKNFHNFLTCMDRWNRKKDVKKLKKVVNDGVLERIWI